MTLTYADLDSLPAYVEEDIRMIREVAEELSGTEAKLAEKHAAEYAARIRNE